MEKVDIFHPLQYEEGKSFGIDGLLYEFYKVMWTSLVMTFSRWYKETFFYLDVIIFVFISTS
jgi:hypothetical protein